MPLFTTTRDAGFLKGINQEYLHSIMSVEVGIYKMDIVNTEIDIYNEAKIKTYKPQVRIYAIIDMQDTETNNDEYGFSKNNMLMIGFLKADLKKADVYLEVGDIIHYDNKYFEVDNVNSINYWGAKNPNSLVGITEDQWDLTGYDLQITAECHLTNLKSLNIEEI